MIICLLETIFCFPLYKKTISLSDLKIKLKLESIVRYYVLDKKLVWTCSFFSGALEIFYEPGFAPPNSVSGARPGT